MHFFFRRRIPKRADAGVMTRSATEFLRRTENEAAAMAVLRECESL
jgi:hypothetical protein